MGESFQPKRRRVWRIAIFAAISLGVAAIILPNYVRTGCGGPTSLRNSCINNLRQIDGAKEQWALENHKQPSDLSITSEIDEYIKGGHPHCPSGGIYTYGKVSESPRCSIKDHVLPP
jgi:hypothetical protein